MKKKSFQFIRRHDFPLQLTMLVDIRVHQSKIRPGSLNLSSSAFNEAICPYRFERIRIPITPVFAKPYKSAILPNIFSSRISWPIFVKWIKTEESLITQDLNFPQRQHSCMGLVWNSLFCERRRSMADTLPRTISGDEFITNFLFTIKFTKFVILLCPFLIWVLYRRTGVVSKEVQ